MENPEENIAPKHAKPTEPAKDGSSKALTVVLIALIAIAVICGGYFAWQQYTLAQDAAKTPENAVPNNPTPTEEKGELPANPVDFTALQQENADIYAWIYVPGTNVNYPVAQNSGDDNYYLNHDRYGNYSLEGTIFSQRANAKDFSDPVTMLYGHNNLDEQMFGSLLWFADEQFFNDHDTIYVYTPGHVLTYKIISSYRDTDRHILNSYDFSNPSTRVSYFNFVENPRSFMTNVRADVKLDVNSKLLQLSTCMTDPLQSNYRYIVSGVLVNDQQTK